MSAVLPLLTVADLEALPDDDNKYELIGGELLVSRSPHYNHQLIQVNIVGALYNYLSKHPIGKVIPETGVIFSEFDAAIPDLVFVTNETFKEIASSDDGKFYGAPDIAIEILSPGKENARRDRVLKLNAYSKFGVKEYWIVDMTMLIVEIYRSSDNALQLAERLRLEDTITSSLLPGFELKVSEIFMF
jgi:Uma2 family endonuclease